MESRIKVRQELIAEGPVQCVLVVQLLHQVVEAVATTTDDKIMEKQDQIVAAEDVQAVGLAVLTAPNAATLPRVLP